MTISTGIEGQNSAAILSQPKKAESEGVSPEAGTDAQATAPETPAVVVDAAGGQAAAADTKLAPVELGTAAEAQAEAQTISAGLAQQPGAIAGRSLDAVAGLLSELEAAVG